MRRIVLDSTLTKPGRPWPIRVSWSGIGTPRKRCRPFCARVRNAVLLVSPLPPLPVICRDPNDDMVLACAVAAGAAYLVTRDKDLLVLQHYEGIAMVTPEAFLALLRANPHY